MGKTGELKGFLYLIEKRGTFLHKMLEGNLIHIIHCYNEGVTWNVGQGDT